MKRSKTVEDFIAANDIWHDGLTLLREILNATELEETIKWGAPTYTIDNKNVVSIGAFKSYFGLWFFNGVFLTDELQCLVAASESTTRGLRQWRFQNSSEINAEQVTHYIVEAIANQKAGKEIKAAAKNTDYEMPDELAEAIANDAELADKFSALAPYKQKEYALHIGSAKREPTRVSRLEKAIPMIREGKGLNDKYRNC